METCGSGQIEAAKMEWQNGVAKWSGKMEWQNGVAKWSGKWEWQVGVASGSGKIEYVLLPRRGEGHAEVAPLLSKLRLATKSTFAPALRQRRERSHSSGRVRERDLPCPIQLPKASSAPSMLRGNFSLPSNR